MNALPTLARSTKAQPKGRGIVPARPVGGDMRFPLPLDEMRRVLRYAHGSLIGRLLRAGMDEEDVWSEVWSGFAGKRAGFDPTKMRRADSWVIAVGRSILLNVLQKVLQPMRAPGGTPEQLGMLMPADWGDPCDRLDQGDMARAVDAAVYADGFVREAWPLGG